MRTPLRSLLEKVREGAAYILRGLLALGERDKQVDGVRGFALELPSGAPEVAPIQYDPAPVVLKDCTVKDAIDETFVIHGDDTTLEKLPRNRLHDSLPYEPNGFIADEGMGVRLLGIAALATSIALTLGLTQMMFRYFGIVVEFRVMAGIWVVLTALASMVLIGGGE